MTTGWTDEFTGRLQQREHTLEFHSTQSLFGPRLIDLIQFSHQEKWTTVIEILVTISLTMC